MTVCLRRLGRLTVVLVVLALVVAACGDSDESTGEASASAVADTTAAPTAEESSPADEAAFPLTIEHKYGETTIESTPERVVSIGFGEHDNLLALGVTPIAVRDWYGEQPNATWPWAQDELGDAQPEVLPSTELNFEQIAALEPDLIVGVTSGMTDSDYETLSAIAPTVAQPAEYIDYGTPWDVTVEMLGRATGHTGEAATVIDETNQLFADARAAHPEFEGATAAVAFYYEDQPGAYASGDNRAQALAQLGFVTPPEFDELAGDSFFFSISQEEIASLDQDVVVWLVGDELEIAPVRDMPLRPTMRAYEEGREIMADPLLSGAFSHAGPLAFQYVIDHLVPELALAVDGDPATAVPSAAELRPGAGATTTTAASAAGLDADQQAAADAWATVFDSSLSVEERSQHLADAETLVPTLEAYSSMADSLGGIALQPTAVAIDGTSATVTFDIVFAGQSAYQDQTGTIDRVGEDWIVSRDEFCSWMATARTPCS